MLFNEVIQDLYSKQRFGIKPGLERTSQLAQALNFPQNTFKTIHIAGTNGKGTTASLIASCLTEAGYIVGLYTSPHIHKFNERIRINGKMISDDALVLLYSELKKISDEIGATFFEITTIMAFQYFAKNNVQVAVIETGMGGRFDSTNIINPLLSIITSIDMDHAEYLGDTLEKIAFEKAGIIKPNTPVIISETRNELIQLFANVAKNQDSDIFYTELENQIESFYFDNEFNANLTLNSKNGDAYELSAPLFGFKQLHNIRTAILALELSSKSFPVSKIQIEDGFLNLRNNTGFSGRCQLINNNPKIIIDVAHNPAAISAICNDLIEIYGTETKYNVVFAAMQDKDYVLMLDNLKQIANRIFITPLKIARSCRREDFEIAVKKLDSNNIEICTDCKDAYAKSITNGKITTLIIGSFYLIGELIEENCLNLH